MNKYITTLAIGWLLAVSACHKSGDTQQTVSTTPIDTFSATPMMSGTRNDSAWTSTTRGAAYMMSQNPSNLVIQGYSATGTLSLVVYDYKGIAGTYDLGNLKHIGSGSFSASVTPAPYDYSMSGTLNIVYVLPDSTLQGTYEFTNAWKNKFKGKFTVKPGYH